MRKLCGRLTSGCTDAAHVRKRMCWRRPWRRAASGRPLNGGVVFGVLLDSGPLGCVSLNRVRPAGSPRWPGAKLPRVLAHLSQLFTSTMAPLFICQIKSFTRSNDTISFFLLHVSAFCSSPVLALIENQTGVLAAVFVGPEDTVQCSGSTRHIKGPD